MKIIHVVGARPNFMKAAPVHRALACKRGIRQIVIHTGQHYDSNMSDVFFRQLRMPDPDLNLRVGSGSHAQQTSEIMSRIEPVLLEHRPQLVMVYGDVNSTLAAALVCSKLRIRVAHVEAGLRSFDRSMPEEINRVVTDQVSDLLFVPSEEGTRNLLREGISRDKIYFVGNVMIDSLVHMLAGVNGNLPAGVPEEYVLLTLHRPSNVDDLEWLKEMFGALSELAHSKAIVFPVHPRTRERIEQAGIRVDSNIRLLPPQPYIDFLALQSHASLVITDSGGIQEETTYLGVPCLTVRENTERPVTVEIGTNTVVGRDVCRMREEAGAVLSGKRKKGRIPSLWDGKAADRIADVIAQIKAC